MSINMRTAGRGWAGLCLAQLAVTAATIDANTFTFVSTNPGTYPNANDFHISIGGNFIDDPKSSVFPNSDGKNTGQGNFSGATLGNNGSHDVKFKSTGNNPKPRGYFTWHDQDKPSVKISAEVRSKALDGQFVSFTPMGGGGLLASLDQQWRLGPLQPR